MVWGCLGYVGVLLGTEKYDVILVVTTHCMPMVVTLNDLQKTSPQTAPGPLAEQTPKARIASYL